MRLCLLCGYGGCAAVYQGEAGLAFGPIGRTGAADAMASAAGGNTAVSLSNSKGIYGGVTLDGVSIDNCVCVRFKDILASFELD